MKNNIILILVVTVLSIVIIAISIILSTDGSTGSDPVSDPETETTQSSDYETSDMFETSDHSSESESQTDSSSYTSDSSSDTSDHGDSSTNESSETSAFDEDTADAIIATAYSLIGTDFVDGGDTPSGFDNSGFIYYVLRQNGYITCPREIAVQCEMGKALEYDELKKGDLVYFYEEDMTVPAFGGIYCGNGKMTACLMPGTQVKEIDISTSYYREHFYKGVSLT